jgi:hypothetical protein
MSYTLSELHREREDLPEAEYQKKLRDTLKGIASALGYNVSDNLEYNIGKVVDNAVPRGYMNLYYFLIGYNTSHNKIIELIDKCIELGISENIIMAALTPSTEK